MSGVPGTLTNVNSPVFPLSPTPVSGLSGFDPGPTLAWSLVKSANWATRMQRSVSGREVRVQDFQWPIWNWTLTFEVLRDAWDLRSGTYGYGPAFPIGYSPYYELYNIISFFNSMKGATIPFLFTDPTDCDTDPQGQIPGAIAPDGGAGVTLGVGDGVTGTWRIVGLLGSPVEPVTVRWVQPPTSAWGIDSTNGLMFFDPVPAFGATIAVGMSYQQRVRFKADTIESEEFMYQLWTMKKLELISVMY